MYSHIFFLRRGMRCDCDCVQVLYTEHAIGASKAECLASFVRKLNSAIKCTAYATLLQQSNAMEIFKGYDLVVDCTDNVATRYLVNDSAVKAKIPLVRAAHMLQDSFSLPSPLCTYIHTHTHKHTHTHTYAAHHIQLFVVVYAGVRECVAWGGAAHHIQLPRRAVLPVPLPKSTTGNNSYQLLRRWGSWGDSWDHWLLASTRGGQACCWRKRRRASQQKAHAVRWE